MARKTHSINGVTFGFIGGGRWQFASGNYSLITPCSGIESASAVAGHVAGGIKREAKHGREGIDGMARKNISNLT